MGCIENKSCRVVIRNFCGLYGEQIFLTVRSVQTGLRNMPSTAWLLTHPQGSRSSDTQVRRFSTSDTNQDRVFVVLGSTEQARGSYHRTSGPSFLGPTPFC